MFIINSKRKDVSILSIFKRNKKQEKESVRFLGFGFPQFSLALVLVMVFSMFSIAIPGVQASGQIGGDSLTGIYGDADSDGKITVKDATRVQKHVAKILTMDTMQQKLANFRVATPVTNPPKLDSYDPGNGINVKCATWIQKYVAKFKIDGTEGTLLGENCYEGVDYPPSTKPFQDPNFEKCVRKLIDKPSGDILMEDVDWIETADFSCADITDLSGIEFFTSLRDLDLNKNNIKDVSKLAGLTNIVTLQLEENYISDISILKALTRLEQLNLKRNMITDISVVQNFTQLQYLDIGLNYITDISPAKDLVHLRDVPNTFATPILDYSPLEKNLEIIIDNCLAALGNMTEEVEQGTRSQIQENYAQNIEGCNAMRAALNDIITPGMTELQKEFAIFNYIVNKITYDMPLYSMSDTYNVFVSGKGICHHYSMGFLLMCRAVGIECYFVEGEGADNTGHAWNIVKIDGEYYCVDTTWADVSDDINYDYFNRSTKYFSVDNVYHAEFKINRDRYPDCPKDFPLAEIQKLVPEYTR